MLTHQNDGASSHNKASGTVRIAILLFAISLGDFEGGGKLVKLHIASEFRKSQRRKDGVPL